MDETDPAIGNVLCPIVTPFEDDSVDLDSLGRHAEWLVDQGVDGIVACGTTGEFPSMTWTERESVVRSLVAAVGDRATIIPCTAATAVEDAISRIQAVDALGADAVLLPPPYFHGPNDPRGVERFYDRVLERVESLVMLYNIPQYATELPPGIVASLATREEVIGLKDSSGNLHQFVELKARLPSDFRMYQGWDLLAIPSLAIGGSGTITGLTNIAPGRYRSIADAMAREDLAGARTIVNETIVDLVNICAETGYVPGIKAYLAREGRITSRAVRPPLLDLDEDDQPFISELGDSLTDT